MKKSLLLSALLIGSLSFASQYDYEFTPLIGYNITEGNIDIDNHAVFGAEIQFNNLGTTLAPELSVLYSNADYSPSNDSTDIFRIALNGVYEYDKFDSITPLAKIGFGYETLDKHAYETYDSMFADIGVGAKVPFTDAIALKLEAVYMLKHNNSRNDSNLALLAGINFAFGQSTQKSSPVEEEPKAEEVEEEVVVVVIEKDDDNDGIINADDKCPNTPQATRVDDNGCALDSDRDGIADSRDKCPNTPEDTVVDAQGCKLILDDDKDGVLNNTDKCPNTPLGTQVDPQGCPLNLDLDNDGVLNAQDKCPNTPDGYSVDADGCVQTLNLQINFENASYNVDAQSQKNIEKFAKFLKDSPAYNVEIIGYTDSIGRESSNKKLSQKRADAVRKLLIADGVEAGRITAIGLGEINPIASNKTAAGRAQNRRIEAKLIKTK